MLQNFRLKTFYFRFEEEDLVKPDFWLILEIDSKPIDQINFESEEARKHRFCKPHEDSELTEFPIINIYHHRRTADEPVQGVLAIFKN